MVEELFALYSWADAKRDSERNLRAYRGKVSAKVGAITSISVLLMIISTNAFIV